MSQEPTEKLTEEEEEIVEFFMDLIPILQEATVDLEKKGLLDEEFLTKKNS